MELSRRLINTIGITVVAAILVAGTLLMVLVSIDTQNAAAQAAELSHSNELTRVELTDLSHQEVMLPWLRHDLDELRKQITVADELSDASALASAAVKSSGARMVGITFGDRQAFAPPSGLGMADDGTPKAPAVAAEAEAPALQLPVTFEVEVSGTAQAAAFLRGLQAGPRLLQVVQAQSSRTNDPKRFTVTVDALMFAAKG
jgi:hypothetical protein